MQRNAGGQALGLPEAGIKHAAPMKTDARQTLRLKGPCFSAIEQDFTDLTAPGAARAGVNMTRSLGA